MKKLLPFLFIFLFAWQSRMSAQCLTSSTPTNNCTSFGDIIASFVLNGITATGNTGCSTNGYGSFATPVWSLTPGQSYTFATSLGGGFDNEGFAIWIDLNNDGTYASSEMLWVASVPAPTQAGTITIPSNATIGTGIRMRLMCSYNYVFSGSDACTSGLGTWGENEDHFVSLVCPAAPAISISSTSTLVCQGSTVALTASGAASYTWSNVGVTNGNPFSPSSSAVYTVTAGSVAAGTCAVVTSTATQSISVTSVPLPVNASASQSSICRLSATTLSATGASNYTWMPGSLNSSSVVVTPTSTTVYTLTGFNGNGCPGTATVNITVRPIPTLSISTSNTAVCQGAQANLNVTGNALTYTWSQGQTGTSISVNPTITTLYSVSGTNSVNCVSGVNQVILVNSNPVIGASAVNSVVCPGGSATLSATGGDTYMWSSGGTTTVTTVNPMSASVYTVTGTNTVNCSSTATVAVDVFMPTMGVSSNTAACSGQPVTLSASGADTYLWLNNNSSSQAISVMPSETTIYTVTGSVTDPVSNIACTASNTVMLTINENPTITATADHSVICLGNAAILTASGAGTTGTYTWTGGSGAVLNATNSVMPIANQTYSVSGKDDNGCKGSASIQIQVSTCVGIATTAADAGLMVYPNPSNGNITITSGRDITLQLINEIGQHIRTIVLSDNAEEKIDGLAEGIYFIIGGSSAGSVKQKIVIAK